MIFGLYVVQEFQNFLMKNLVKNNPKAFLKSSDKYNMREERPWFNGFFKEAL